MAKPRSVTSLQLSASIGTCIIGVGILAFPRITTHLTKTGAPFATTLAVLVTICGVLMLVYLGNQYSEHTLFEYADFIVGKWIGGLMMLLIGSYFMVLSALTIREFGEVVVTSVLQRTPIPATVIVLVILVTIASRNDIAKFVRILTFYMPLVYFPALVVVVLSLKSARMVNLMPVLAGFNGIPLKDTILAVGVVIALFQNFFVTSLIVPFMYHPRRAWRAAILGIAAGGGLFVILMYATLSVFGTQEMENLMWPTLELAKTAALPAFFIERIDPIFLAVWVTAVFCSVYTSYFLALNAFSHVFRFYDHRALTFVGAPILISLAAVPSSVANLYDIVKNVGIVGLPFTLGYPLLLIVVHWLRKGHRPLRRKGAKTQ